MNYFIHMLLYLLRCEEYFSVIICTFYIIDCVQGLEFFHCNFYIIGLEKNHFGPKSILLCTNRKWGFLQCSCYSCKSLHYHLLIRACEGFDALQFVDWRASKPSHALQSFKNEMYRENGASRWKFCYCTQPTQAEFFIWARYI